jgi:hypothetical protein
MTRSAPRSIEQYLNALRAEVASHPDKSEADVLELIASTYGAPDEVASAYRDTEAKVKAAMTGERMPRRPVHQGSIAGFWARGVGRLHAMYAKALLVAPTAV